ncbi:trans-4-hydroxy-L-proline dehydratase activase [Pelosinus propionicus]|uniref:Pyruvate formate lyase activating enzyme n=1 Tax=Pelosinus propionicus DSM 13327 TaxID=1123291 RepID=A0A1I4NDQ0_9FIRM|nr:trans-4-hydroxy-L-proline dehydratase activase [Pelosinus propionicus]SFM13631.1 pyruvate formate lyase activating enzyme [Pelosinus propionicus DSM 13327]
MRKAVLFNIQKFSVHDGPGIRTTIFFKGCPLACQWCHNPESQSYQAEILIDRDRCTQCGECEKHCSQQAVWQKNHQLFYDAEKCNACEMCIDYCCNNAREIAGKEYTVQDVMQEIHKDKPFYEQSGGGVTLSGGEVMIQIDFIEELVKACKEQGITVAIDTCGYAPSDNFLRIIKYVDVFLYDIKLMDSGEHEHYTGRDNALILENLKLLSNHDAVIQLRLPLIEGINTKNEQIQDIIDFIADLNIHSINLLPYHHMGQGKYKKLNCPLPVLERPTDLRLEEIRSMFKQANYKVQIGG